MDEEPIAKPRLRLKDRPKDPFQIELKDKLKQRRREKTLESSDDDSLDNTTTLAGTTSERKLSSGSDLNADWQQVGGTHRRPSSQDFSDSEMEAIFTGGLRQTVKTNKRSSSRQLTKSPEDFRQTTQPDSAQKLGRHSGRKTPVDRDGSKSPDDSFYRRNEPSAKKFMKQNRTTGQNREWQPPTQTGAPQKQRGLLSDSSDDELMTKTKGKTSPFTGRMTPESPSSQQDKPKFGVRNKLAGDKTPPPGNVKLAGDKTPPPGNVKLAGDKTPPPSNVKLAGDKTPPPGNVLKHLSTQKIESADLGTTQSSKFLKNFSSRGSAEFDKQESYRAGDRWDQSRSRSTSRSREHTPESKIETEVLDIINKSSIKRSRNNGRKIQFQTSPRDSQEQQKEFSMIKKKPELSPGRKWPEKSAPQESSLLDFLKDERTEEPHKHQPRKSRRQEHDSFVDDLFGNASSVGVTDRKSPVAARRSGHDVLFDDPSPKAKGRKTPENKGPSPQGVSRDPVELNFQSEEQKTEDTSSLCEEPPLDLLKQMAAKDNRKQTTERARADAVIEAVTLSQSVNALTPTLVQKKRRPRSASAKVQHRLKPGPKPGSQETPLFTSTENIRSTVYQEWYVKHLEAAKHNKKLESEKKEAEEEKMKKEKEDKCHEAESSYKAWLENKKKKLLEDYKRQEKIKLKEKETEDREKKEVKEKAHKIFEHWKQKKEEQVKKERHTKQEEVRKVEEQKKKLEQEKLKERERSHKKWISSKENWHKSVVEKHKKEELNSRSKLEIERESMKVKESEAERLYLTWLNKKEKQEMMEKAKLSAQKRKADKEEEFRPAFFPASRSIPFGR